MVFVISKLRTWEQEVHFLLCSPSLESFYFYFYLALHICSDPSNHSNELNYLKSLALFRRYNPSIIRKALNKFKKSKRSRNFVSILSLCLFILSSLSKSLKSFNKQASKSPFGLLTKFSSPQKTIPTENRWGVYIIPCFSCNLGCVG